jgi:UDP-glucose 4-epimerase
MMYLKKMRIGVTGGAGFIGSNLVRHLVLTGHEVSILDNLETGYLTNLEGTNANLVRADLKKANEVEAFFQEEEIDHCIHLGALGSVPRSVDTPRASFEANAIATLNVLESVKNRSLPIVFSSSSSVYGKNPKLPKIEKDWLSPISPYAASKLAAEAMILAFRESYGIPTLVYRLFNVYGPRQNPESLYAAVIPKWIFAAFNGEPLIVYGDGEQKRDFTFVDDVVQVLSSSIREKHDADYPVNLAFGNPVTLNEILEVFKTYFGEVKVEYRGIRKGDIRDSESDPKTLRELHKNQIHKTPLENGLVATFEWFKRQYSF